MAAVLIAGTISLSAKELSSTTRNVQQTPQDQGKDKDKGKHKGEGKDKGRHEGEKKERKEHKEKKEERRK